MTKKPLIMPSLRGSFGNWIYYSCLMPIEDVGSRVQYAEEIHRDKALSKLIQRSLEGGRAKHISDYLLSNDERFFNSMVLATYGGSPEWLEVGNFRSKSNVKALESIPEEALDTIGFLSFTGKEKIFAIDGQHRLAGIKLALENGLDVSQDRIPVILVGHKNTAPGLRRSRRLFTTLNKTAVPVNRRDIIALDEDDVMAIVARRLVETEPAFRDPKIAVISSRNIPSSNHVCLTTISNLYDILKLIFLNHTSARTDRKLRFNRPSDEKLDEFYEVAKLYLNALGSTFRPIRDLFNSTTPEAVTSLQRTSEGGNVLFRPIGLEIFTRVAILLAKRDETDLPAAVTKLKRLPTAISSPPFKDVIWDSARHRLNVRGKALALELVKYMVGLEVNEEKLEIDYKNALGKSDNDETFRLPIKII